MEMREQAQEPVCESKVVVEEAQENTEPQDEKEVKRVVYATIDEVVEATRALSERPAQEMTREEIASLKQQFYAFVHAATQAIVEAQAQENSDDNGEEVPVAEVVIEPLPIETTFKELLEVIKEKKAQYAAEVEAQKERNLKQRDGIIEEMLAMSADADNVNREFPRFKELQQQFKDAGEVPATAATDQWKRYQDAVEKFYDQYRINKDLRDYDFRKNLDTKLLLCDEAEKLASEEDVVVAFKHLQALHDTWRDTGPVAKEMRDEIWNRFKDASAVINKRYQAFFEERKAREQQNEEAKVALCERVEAINVEGLDTFKQWDTLTATVLEAQQEWKSLGYASRRVNNELFARFRAACDRFFTAKAEYFKETKDKLAENLQLKTSLCEEAEALRESTDWKRTADRLVELQKRWKAIGPVPRKQSEALWTRFQQACDHFFEQKKKDLSESRNAEQAALNAKRAIIAEVKAIGEGLEADKVQEMLRDCDNRWRQAGHVPFRDKDKIYDEYRAAVNEVRDNYKLSRGSRQMARFESTLADLGNDSNKIGRERERLMRAYEAKRQELKTCENNLGFFTTKSSRGNAMMQELDRRIAAVKEDLETLRSKIALLDEKI